MAKAPNNPPPAVETPATETPAAEAATSVPAAEAAPSKGIRAQRAIMLKQFVPGIDWINVNVVAKGKGAQAIVARIVGVVISTRDKTNTLPDGSTAPSIVLEGQFESESYLTGEVAAASSLYVPEAMSGAIKAMFASDETLKTVAIDLDVGLEATGKTIPYTWMLINHVEQPDSNLLKAMRIRRQKPANAVAPLQIVGPTAQAQIGSK